MTVAVVTLIDDLHQRNLHVRRDGKWAAIAIAFAAAGMLDGGDDVPASKRAGLVYDRPDNNRSPWARMLRDEWLRQPSIERNKGTQEMFLSSVRSVC